MTNTCGLGDELLAPLAELSEGTLICHRAHGPIVRLQRNGIGAAPVVVAVPSVEHGQRLLAGVTLGADATVARFTVRNPYAGVLGVIGGILPLAFVTLLFTDMEPPGGLSSLLAAIVALTVTGQVTERVVVGRDGITGTWLGRTRLVPLADVVDVSNTDALLQLTMNDGRKENFGARQFSSRRQTTNVTALRQRIEHVRERSAAETTGAAERKVLARGDDDISAWVQRLLTGVHQAGTHRVAPASTVRLWSLVEGATASPMDRAAAAVALAQDEESRQRLRIVADTTASESLRIAIEAAG